MIINLTLSHFSNVRNKFLTLKNYSPRREIDNKSGCRNDKIKMAGLKEGFVSRPLPLIKFLVTIYNVTVNMSVIARRKWLSDEAIQLFHHYRQIKRLDCHALTGSQ